MCVFMQGYLSQAHLWCCGSAVCCNHGPSSAPLLLQRVLLAMALLVVATPAGNACLASLGQGVPTLACPARQAALPQRQGLQTAVSFQAGRSLL